MKIRNRIYSFIVLISLLGLSACNGMKTDETVSTQATVEGQGKLNPPPAPPAEKDFNAKLQDWLRFVGKDQISDENLQVLTEASQGGCCGNIQGLKAYLFILSINDLDFVTSVDQLKFRNQDFFHDFQCLTTGTSPVRSCENGGNTPAATALFHIQSILTHYNEMIDSANFARNRLVESAAILGFTISPATQSLDSIENNFVQPINSAIVDANAAFGNTVLFPPERVPSIDASLLKAVSLQMDDGSVLSFFDFVLNDPNTDAAGRGSLNVLAAEMNPILVIPRFKQFPRIPLTPFIPGS